MPDPIPLRPMSAANVSPLMLSHELLELAERAGRAGFSRSAKSLLDLAHTVCTERPAGAGVSGRVAMGA